MLQSNIAVIQSHNISVPKLKYKKALGAWGESCVDVYLQKCNWAVYKKNEKIFKGEIDRVFIQKDAHNSKIFCVAEIKTQLCVTSKNFYTYFTHTGMSQIIKPAQIKNLHQYSETLLARNSTNIQIYIRFFIVLKIVLTSELKNFLKAQTIFKVCLIERDFIILSFFPERP